MTYSRRNKVEEQQEAAQQAQRIAALCCDQLHITLDAINWQEWGMQAPVKVHGVEVSLLFDLAPRVPEDLLRLIQIKLLERAALEATHAREGVKASMWSPVAVVQPQEFLSLWIITLETDERVPIMENLSDGQRVYEIYPFDATDRHQLAALFGRVYEGAYHVGDLVTIKEHARLYTGEVIYSLPPDKDQPSRRPASKGYHTVAGTAYTNDIAAKYIVNCHDGFPHIVSQSQIVPEH
jgi:hypothetical protein